MAKRGAVWLAYGEKFLLMAAHSARTLKEVSPSLGRSVITNVPVSRVKFFEEDLFSDVIFVDEPTDKNREKKVSIPDWSPFEETLFLDCDTECLADVSGLFSLLRNWPLIIKHNPWSSPREIDIDGVSSVELGLSEWNSGLIVFRKGDERVGEFFDVWRLNYELMGEGMDQPSLVKTIYSGGVVVPLAINGLWNAKRKDYKTPNFVDSDVKVNHYVDIWRDPSVSKRFEETLRGIEVVGFKGEALCVESIDSTKKDVFRRGKFKEEGQRKKSFLKRILGN
ncbi:hypothetical protein [Aquisalimonas asiatica]|uniref:Nucleotide-diphospho-sugar transferase n=1 Tax=Aquisalimonas asiatica TaxID=406100 RepID=A0A1H8VH37_9GAMM|nr:hypothetical protein [Aquisalimonas asiatica]SEP14762.1 hypothetical protein SAMN04488052_11274 [Aquisalimonas asiatica]